VLGLPAFGSPSNRGIIMRIVYLLTLSLLAVALTISPARAATPIQTAPTPIPTIKACLICDEGLPQPVVRGVMFWMDGCPHCEGIIHYVLPPLRAKYGAQFDLLMLQVVDAHDVDTLYRVAESYNIPKEQTGVPFLIIGDHVLVGSDQVREQLPVLIDDYLEQGGVDWPENPILADFLPTAAPVPSASTEVPTATPAVPSTENESASPAEDSHSESVDRMHDSGFTLAIIVMLGMTMTLICSLIAFAIGRTFSIPEWGDWLSPALIVIGIGVAGYLSYIETQSATAACGPVGDCNAVQSSRYAKLFDVLPIGVFGLLGYLGLLIAWLVRKFMHHFEKPAAVGFWGMAFFAVIFSLYITYLELFVIKAVCIWCLTSAVIVTLLLLLGTPPTLRQFAEPEDE